MRKENRIWIRLSLLGLTLLVSLAGMVFLSSCDDDEDTPSYVQFEEQGKSVDEGDGINSITVTLTEAADAESQISFTVEGTAYLDGDFKILTPSPLIIPAGQTSANIQIQILDESLIERGDDEIELTITSVSSSLVLSEERDNLKYTLVIIDNDEVPESDLQVDLSWYQKSGLNNSIDDVNLDLYLLYDVLIEDDEITYQGEVYTGSAETSGFESLKVSQKDKDQEYYLVISYTEGSSDVKYNLNFNGFGYEDEMVEGDFSVGDSGFAVYWGPFYKDGNAFGRTGSLIGKARPIRGNFRR